MVQLEVILGLICVTCAVQVDKGDVFPAPDRQQGKFPAQHPARLSLNGGVNPPVQGVWGRFTYCKPAQEKEQTCQEPS